MAGKMLSVVLFRVSCYNRVEYHLEVERAHEIQGALSEAVPHLMEMVLR
jgi:hypothetical protein